MARESACRIRALVSDRRATRRGRGRARGGLHNGGFDFNDALLLETQHLLAELLRQPM